MEKLIEELEEQIEKLKKVSNDCFNLNEKFLDDLYSVYPFNKFEYIISHLIANDIITLEDYLEIRNSYLERNKYLYVFEITAPRTFGETWAQRHLNEIVPELKRPSKKYDVWLKESNIKEFDEYEVGVRDILEKIIEKSKRED